MPQVDTNGAIVDAPLPPAGSSGAPDTGLSPDVVTISSRPAFPWEFWLLLGLGAWWVYGELKG